MLEKQPGKSPIDGGFRSFNKISFCTHGAQGIAKHIETLISLMKLN